MKNPSHIALVSLQILCIILILSTGPIIPDSLILNFVFWISLAFGFWAMAEMKFRFNVFPALLENSNLVTSGPYSVVRHPMYTSLIFSMLSLVLSDLSVFRIALWLVLFIVLLIKSIIEDTIMESEFDGYGNYESRTRRIIPYIL